MKIAIVGCGALGLFYGAHLARSKLNVHFLLRSDYDHARHSGIHIQTSQNAFRIQPNCARDPEAIGPCDLVVIGLKTTANHLFPELLPPLVDSNTLILTLQNGLGNEEELARCFGPQNILGGLCFVCLNRIEPGTVRHMGHGQIVLGEYQRKPQARTHAVAGLFRNAGIPCEITEDLERAHWEKLVWNVPFNGLGVASSAGLNAVLTGQALRPPDRSSCLTTNQLLNRPEWHRIVRELMQEIIATAQRLGFAIPFSLADTQIERTIEMGAYKPSTLVDFERGQPLELESLFLRPLRAATGAGVPVPRLTALCQLLQSIDPLSP